MSGFFNEMPDGYRETIQKGRSWLHATRSAFVYGCGNRKENIARLEKELCTADAIVIGAGAGLSASAGLTYSGERFERYFFDFMEKFGIRDMYAGGFYPFPDEETLWAWWARHIYYNRYVRPPKPVYVDMLSLVRGKDYFVITTNVDHQFQRAGFDKRRLFYTQGDYGLFQSVGPYLRKTYDNEGWVMQAMAAQGFVRDGAGVFRVPEDRAIAMRIPSGMIPRCPDDGGRVTMNLRADEGFVEDDGWRAASTAYAVFLKKNEGRHVLFWEMGVGGNTPMIIKYPFWAMTAENPGAVYACLNLHEAACPALIEDRSICIDGDMGSVLAELATRLIR